MPVLFPPFYSLINYDRLRQLLCFNRYDDVRANHKQWVESCLQNQTNSRDEKWTRSIVVGSRLFIDAIKKEMRLAAKHRKRIEIVDSFQLRERTRL